MKLLMVFFTMVISTAYACPEMNDQSIGSGNPEALYVELDTTPIALTEYEFNQIPNFTRGQFQYEECKDSLRSKTMRSKVTGRIFTAVYTNEDECDGGNSYGALFNEDITKLLGDIGDSYISCY